MGYLVLLAVLAFAGWMVLRGPGAPARRAEVNRPDATTLERDPNTGVYRATERDGS